MITGLEHIGVAVQDLDAAIELWCKATGGRVTHRELVAEQHVEIAVIEIGSLHVELLRPTADNSPIAKFITARGPGIHHLALRCDNAQSELDRLKRAGLCLIDERCRIGAEQSRVGFLHPKAMDGVLVEVVEPKPA